MRIKITFSNGNLEILVQDKEYYRLSIPFDFSQRGALMMKIGYFTEKHGTGEFRKIVADFVKIFGQKISPQEFHEVLEVIR